MILLDTNIISELMRPTPEPRVSSWVDEQVLETLFISSITVAELRFGVGALPEGQRRQKTSHVLDRLLPLFEGRVLAFDVEAAEAYAQLAVAARQTGKGFPIPDGYIAAIAHSKGFWVATRDSAAFAAAALRVINPWDAPG